MQLLIVRHADAGDAGDWARAGNADHLRPLSAKGRKQMAAVAEALRGLVPECARIVSSPYVRALETAEFLRDAYRLGPAETTRTLEPSESPEQFADWLREHPASGVTGVTGHEPHLSTFVTWLLAGSRESRVRVRKAAACLVTLDDAVRAGESELQWLMGPDQLAALSSVGRGGPGRDRAPRSSR